MSGGVQRFARRWWAGELGPAGSVLSTLVAPASWAWSGAAALQARAAARRGASRVEGIRVVSVGNLAVGGTGKTPLTAWLARSLHAAGAPTSVVVGAAGSDEVLLHRRWNPGVPAIAESHRAEGAARARDEGARVVVLDDGFQHRSLARDLDLVLLSADDPFPGAVLPRGPYREPPRALDRADAVLVTRRAASPELARRLAARVEGRWPGLVLAGVRLAPGAWTRLDGAPGTPPTGDVLAACGVARPEAFRAAVGHGVSGAVELVAFADHRAYAERDVGRLVERAAGRPLVVTEKDAVKLAAFGHLLAHAWVLADELRWDWGEEATRARLLELVGETALP